MKTFPSTLFIALCAITCATLSCSSIKRMSAPKATPTPTPTVADAIPVKYADACRKENNEKVLALEGYFGTGSMLNCFGEEANRKCYLKFRQRPGETEGYMIRVKTGKGANQMEELGNFFSPEDLHLRLNDGKLIGALDRVRVIALADTTGAACSLDTMEIQAPPPGSTPEPTPEIKAEAVAFADACKPEHKDKMIAVGGYLNVPFFLLCKQRGIIQYCGLDFHADDKTGGDNITANIDVGKEANQMEGLRDQYQPKDLRVRTSVGKVVGYKDRVTLVGKVSKESDLCRIDVAQIKTP
ncbi:MAG: hypothetical protein WCB68_10585 [Pyrinomonadaceae bacterium]